MKIQSFWSGVVRGAACCAMAALLAVMVSSARAAGQDKKANARNGRKPVAVKVQPKSSAGSQADASRARAEDLQVCVDDKCRGAAATVYLRDKLFVDAESAAKLLGGGTVSCKRGKLVLKFGATAVQLSAGSGAAKVGAKDERLPLPPQERNGRLFVPVEFFSLPTVCNALGKEIEFNETAWSLDAKASFQVGELDYFSYGSRTRVSVSVNDVTAYKTAENGRLAEVRIPKAVVPAPDRIEIRDGLVETAASVQDGDDAVIRIERAEKGGALKVTVDSDSLDIEVAAVEKEPPSAISRAGIKGSAKPAAPVKQEAKLVPDAVVAQSSAQPKNQSASSPSREAATPAKQPEARLELVDSVSIPKTGKVRVVIDAGHGGKDPGGSRRKGVPEKTLNLSMANDIAGYLRSDGRFEVLMTRTSDVFLPLDRRSQIANNWQADIFISLHANANSHKKESGYEVYFMSENATDPWAAETADFENSVRGMEEPQPESTAGFLLHNLARNEYMNEAAHLAGMVAKGMDRKTPIKNSGVKQAAFYVLRGTYSPAILVEMGYMTNASDVKYLNNAKMRKQMAKGIYEGIVNYAKSRGRIKDKAKKK